MAQWLRICLPRQATRLRLLVGELTSHRATKPARDSKSFEPQLLSPRAPEPVLHSKRRPRAATRESPHTAMEAQLRQYTVPYLKGGRVGGDWGAPGAEVEARGRHGWRGDRTRDARLLTQWRRQHSGTNQLLAGDPRRLWGLEEPPCKQQPRQGSNPNVHQQRNGERRRETQWSITQPLKRTTQLHLQQHGRA